MTIPNRTRKRSVVIGGRLGRAAGAIEEPDSTRQGWEFLPMEIMFDIDWIRLGDRQDLPERDQTCSGFRTTGSGTH